MSSLSSRKSFLAKLGGIAAAAGLMPKAVAARTAVALPTARNLTPRPESRAVARRADSV